MQTGRFRSLLTTYRSVGIMVRRQDRRRRMRMKSRSVDGEIKLVGYYPNYRSGCLKVWAFAAPTTENTD